MLTRLKIVQDQSTILNSFALVLLSVANESCSRFCFKQNFEAKVKQKRLVYGGFIVFGVLHDVQCAKVV